MNLFVINRHNEQSGESPAINEESHIARVLKRIERRKFARLKQKERLKHTIACIENTKRKRHEKRKRKANIVSIPTGDDEFIDKNITESTGQNTEVPKRKMKKTKLETSEIEGFTILGNDNFNKKTKVKRVLPKWLSNPSIISVNLQELQTKTSSIKELDKDLRKKLKANNIKYFFPVQVEVIPWLLRSFKQSKLIYPRDICVSAPTGSGKTLSFVLPIVQAMKCYHFKRIRALVILPTQDLAMQVFKTFKKYTQDTHIDVCLITGKCPFAMEQKQLVVEYEAFGCFSKADILVCTAGRLVDHLKGTKGFNLQHLKYLVIDEADKVLDNVQNDWLYHLEQHLSNSEVNLQVPRVLNLFTLQKQRPPQKLLFSATLSQDPEKLQKLSLFQPKLFTSIIETDAKCNNIDQINTDSFIGKYTTPRELTEKYIECSLNLKPLVLYEFIKQEKLTKTMIFVHSVESAHRLAILLQSLFKDQLIIEEISSQLETNCRNLLVDNFSKGSIDVIVCTDRLARGIDLKGVQCVISYSPPKYLKNYIHRVGRTARAGEFGLAVTLLNKTQLNKFLELLQQAGKTSLDEIKISEDGLETLSEQYKGALENLKKTVANEEKESIKKAISAKRQLKKRKFQFTKSNK